MREIPIEEVDDIAEELAPTFCRRTLSELRKDFRSLDAKSQEFKITASKLYELFALASQERYRRMGVEVKPGNMRRMREPGEDND
jgi:hypothetical protein